jgi:ABC-type sugar transport system substrate-binding protein
MRHRAVLTALAAALGAAVGRSLSQIGFVAMILGSPWSESWWGWLAFSSGLEAR